MTYKDEIIKEYKYKIELHAHTKPTSMCADFIPSEVMKTYKVAGYDGVVITNHFVLGHLGDMSKEEYLKEYEKAFLDAEEIGDEIGIRAYFGAELRFSENNNDYMLYGVDKDILEVCYDYLHTDLATFRKNVKLDKSVLVQAHPFRDGVSVAEAEYLDGYEIFNMHPGHNSRNGFSAKKAKETGKKINTAGTDFHHMGHDGLSAIRTKILPEDSFELAEILRSGEYVLDIGGVIVLP